MRKLQFLTNDAFVLMHVANNPNSTLRAISIAVGITERATQPILNAMEQDGIIARERVGRGTYYRVHYHAVMHHPLEGPFPTVAELVRELFELFRRLGDEDDEDGGPSPVPV